MIGHARHLHVKDIMPEAFPRRHTALDRGEGSGEEFSLRLELAPEREDLVFEKTFKLGSLTLRKPQNNRIRLRHRIVFGQDFSYPLLSKNLGNYRNQFGPADYDQAFEGRLKARLDGAR